MSNTDVAPEAFRPEHPIFHDPSWALADALVCDAAVGLPPARAVAPILQRLRALGWDITRVTAPDPEPPAFVVRTGRPRSEATDS